MESEKRILSIYSVHEDPKGTTSPHSWVPPQFPPHVRPPRPSAPAPQMPQQHQPAASYNSVCPVPIPRAVTDAGAPLLPLSQPSEYPGSSSSSAPLPEAVGHDAKKNYWECQTQTVKKNEDIHKKLSIWLLGLYYISFHLHRITPSPCETGRDWVSVTQGSSHLCKHQSILSCNTLTCNFADEMIIFAVSPSCSIKIQFYGVTFPMDVFCYLFQRRDRNIHVLLATAET